MAVVAVNALAVTKSVGYFIVNQHKGSPMAERILSVVAGSDCVSMYS